ncbi:GtrA family protein [Candidatus Galacturonibacter soehngenii]|uniref:GtrA family protein n=1 Tax=Candidatus Galacturonatibacter soehngenii TaxID=2307010 RepID=A0A7V7UBX1_9FIRM|nr:GtrA family protein [Candidatus Galacturonibacter soehngenii]KAB1438225.1 GtrA family protein [Candidatus Galacturonibacter soehngenii]
MKKLIEQIMKFGVVGFLCFFIDYFVLFAATEILKINYLVSSGISFTVSVIINYILSTKFVFQTKQDTNKMKEFILFVILSLVGLGINQIIMWFTVEKVSIYYMLGKIIATAIVMVYNFITRKIFLEDKEDR